MAALVGWQVLALLGGDSASLASAIALIVLTLVGAGAVAAFAVALWRRHSAGRSGAVVTQLLLIAVAWGAATGSYAHPAVALVLAVPAIACLVLLVLSAIADRPDQGADGRS